MALSTHLLGLISRVGFVSQEWDEKAFGFVYTAPVSDLVFKSELRSVRAVVLQVLIYYTGLFVILCGICIFKSVSNLYYVHLT